MSPRQQSTGDRAGKLLHTRNAYLALLRRRPGLSRLECARALGVSTFNVSRLTEALLRQKLVEEVRLPDAPRAKGRPGVPLRLAGSHECAAGFDLEASALRMAVVDFAGSTVCVAERPFVLCASARAYEAQLRQAVTTMVAGEAAVWKRVRQVVFAAPGIVAQPDGVVRRYPALERFVNVAVGDVVGEASMRPTRVTHNVLGLAHYYLWKKPEAANWIVAHVVIRSGVGLVTAYRGQILAGRAELAGELGVFPVLGASATLEDRIGLSSLRKRLPRCAADVWAGEGAAVSRALADRRSGPVLALAAADVARVVSGIEALYAPDEVIVHSPLFAAAPLWDVVEGHLARLHQPEVGGRCTVRPSDMPPSAAAEGAALHALALRYPVQDRVGAGERTSSDAGERH